MSTKTLRKRIALVAVSALGAGMLSLVAVPAANATATTETASSVTGDIVAQAGGAVTGSFSVTLAEAAGNTWDGANTTITVQLLDNNMNADVCTINTNADGTPKGAVISGQSDTLFATASSVPVLSMSSGDMTVTISDTYDDAAELESVTVSGLTATCLSTAATGTIFVKVTAGTAEILGANVVSSGSIIGYDNAVAAATSAAYSQTSATVPVNAADNSGVKMLIGSTSKFPLVYNTSCTAVWIGGVAAGFGLTIDGLGYDTSGYAYAMVNDAAVDLGVARPIGTVVGQPGTTYAATLTGSCTSTTYLGSIGKVTAAASLTVDTTKVVSSVASNVTTANNDGQIEITEISSGYIGNGEPTTITVTLTNGQFASAPTLTTVGAAMTNLTPSYPTSTLTLYRADGTATGVSIHGAITPSTTMAAGDSVTVAATIANADDPVVVSSSLYVDGVLTTSRTNKVITYAAATASTSAPYSINVLTTTAQAGAVINVNETGAATFGAGRYVAVCFNDAGGDLFNAASRQVWAKVTSGDLKLSGNKTEVQATIGTGAAVVDSGATYTDFNGAAGNQCAYTQIYSASTTKSTITFYAGNAANTAADTVGAYITAPGSSAGSMTMGVFAGSSLASLTLYSKFVYGTRNAIQLYSVTASGTPTVTSPGSNQAYGDLSISEAAKGVFAVGAITVDLTNAAGSQADPVATWATAGANAPTVTQTNSASDIVWSYVVTDANTVTITVTQASTTAPATFKVSNIKSNVLGSKSAGVAVANSDLYLTAAGAGLNSTSYSVQAASLPVVAATTTVTNAEVLSAIVKLIASINKQITALQKLLTKKK